MQPEQAKKFLQALGVHNPQYSGGKWVQSPCVLAPFTHKGGKDTRPSFGVAVGDRAVFNCFVCGSGSLSELVGRIELYLKSHPEQSSRFDLKAARLMAEQAESELPVLPIYSEFKDNPFSGFHEWPMWWLSKLDDWTTASSYLLVERGLTAAVCDDFRLRYDPHRRMVVAPIFTAGGRLAGARGRLVDGPGLPHYDYAHFGFRNTHLVWFNERALNLDGPMVLVEGQFDAMRISKYHPKVMAILSTRPTPYKLRKLYGSPVILALDNDQPGRDNRDLLIDQLRDHPQVGVVEYPTEDPDDPAWFKDCGQAPETWVQETFSGL